MKNSTDKIRDYLLGKRLKEYRQAAGMTQKQLGELVGITPSAICYLESGSRSIAAKVAIELSKVFGVDSNTFVDTHTSIKTDKEFEAVTIRSIIMSRLNLLILEFIQLSEDVQELQETISKYLKEGDKE